MTIRNRIKQDPILQYVVQSLELLSPVGQRILMAQTLYHDSEQLTQAWDHIDRVLPLLNDADHAQTLVELRHQLMCLHDIQGTLGQLQTHQTLTEVDLYEVKHLAHLNSVTRRDIALLGLDSIITLPDLSAVFDLLDPDNTGIDNFYIYDSYDDIRACIFE